MTANDGEQTPLRLDTTIRAPRHVVFDHLTTPDGLNAWWSTSASFDPNGSYHLHFAGPDVHLRGDVTEFSPPSGLAITWSWDHEDEPPTLVRFLLAEADGETALTVHHTATSIRQSADHRAGWKFFLPRLKEAAEAATSKS